MNVIKSLSFLTMFFLVSELTAGQKLVRKVGFTTTTISLKVHSVSLSYGRVVITGEIASGTQSASTQETYSNGVGPSSGTYPKDLNWSGIVRVASNSKNKAPDGCLSLAMQAAALGKSITIIDESEEQIFPTQSKQAIYESMPIGVDYSLNNLRDCTLSFK